MIPEKVKKFVSQYSHIAVYGAGLWGQALVEILLEEGITVREFIVSDGQATNISLLQKIPVYELSTWITDCWIHGSTGVLVAMSATNRDEIEMHLNGKEFKDYLWIDREFFSETETLRQLYPVDMKHCLLKADPLSRRFGQERGKPIDRFYIECFLKAATKECKKAYQILEVGEDRYSRLYFNEGDVLNGGTHKISYDILHYEQGMDLTKPETLPKDKYDVFICTQVFNFIYDVKAAIQGAYFVLKRGGKLLATVQGCIGQVSSNDMKHWGDYWRFTDLGIKRLVGDVFGEKNVEVFPFGNAAIATAWVQGLALEDLPKRELLEIVDPYYAINIGVIARKE